MDRSKLTEQMWRAVLTRDVQFNDAFVYAVDTTGVFCRPTCGSRRPLRSNVHFFVDAASAKAEGYRPCRRCLPERLRPAINDVVRELAQAIEQSPQQALTLRDLAARTGYSAFHLQRQFKLLIGSTPKTYQNAVRMNALKAALRRDDGTVADAVYAAGFGSGSRMYEQTQAHLGMTPTAYRRGGEGLLISYASGATALGLLMIGATDRGICSLQFGEDHDALRESLRQRFPNAHLQPMPDSQRETFHSWLAALNEHLQGVLPRLNLPLDVRGTAFQLIVWRYLQQIPYGDVATYAQVAAAIGKPSAARAVALACASNPVALLVPCHRVVRGDGGLGGFRWGVARKRVLLDTERTRRK